MDVLHSTAYALAAFAFACRPAGATLPVEPAPSIRPTPRPIAPELAGPHGPLLRVWVQEHQPSGSSLPRAFRLRGPGGDEASLTCVPVDWGPAVGWQCAPWREWDRGVGRYRFEMRNRRGEEVAASFTLDGTESRVVVHVRRGGSPTAYARPHRPWSQVDLVEVSADPFPRLELRNGSNASIPFFDFYLRARSVHLSPDGSITHLMPVPVCGDGMHAFELAPGAREAVMAPVGFGGPGAYEVWITGDGPGEVVYEARLRVHYSDATPLESEPSTVTERVWRPSWIKGA